MKKEYIKPKVTLVSLTDEVMFNGASQNDPGVSGAREIRTYDDFWECERPIRYERYQPFRDYDEYIEYNYSLWD